MTEREAAFRSVFYRMCRDDYGKVMFLQRSIGFRGMLKDGRAVLWRADEPQSIRNYLITSASFGLNPWEDRR